jgi:hypothetical protein
MKFFALILFLVLSALAIAYLENNPEYCGGISYCKELSLNGTISNKYLDYRNHGYQTILVKGEGGNYNEKIVHFITDTSKVYKIIAVGDYVRKNKNSLIIYITHNGIKKELTLKCMCN